MLYEDSQRGTGVVRDAQSLLGSSSNMLQEVTLVVYGHICNSFVFDLESVASCGVVILLESVKMGALQSPRHPGDPDE